MKRLCECCRSAGPWLPACVGKCACQNTEVRMMYQSWKLVCAAVALIFGISSPAVAIEWQMLPEKSTLTFEGTQTGSAFSGSFGKFDADIVFDPAAPGNANISVVVETASFSSGSSDRDSQAVGPEWFATEAFPKAQFTATAVEKRGDGWLAKGKLRIKEAELPVELPFTLTVNGESAVAEGEMKLDRTQWSVGTGDWSDGSFVGTDVTLHFHVEATSRVAVGE
ncbi:YceI family protein (plasmid) [Sinorhizobium mexicanum]|uniref:YceI family protein n=2 Tax=Sinorhizobium mexicanum TaxID=375549 RepID=A0A859QQL0_9HYPH|nr:YceI family protein [Sinorhizobium mexicanum]